MLGSFSIASLFGIRIRLHATFVLLILVLLFVGWPSDDPFLTAGFLGVLFGIVLLHELGHGLAARAFGLSVLDVTLWPLGGMTRMSRIPEDSKVEGWIAFAGPAVNLALGFLALPFAPPDAFEAALHGQVLQGENAWRTSASLFAMTNFSLAAFNLLPAFPLDGGRIARALLATRSDWVTATRRAASIGKWIGLAMIAYGLYALFSEDGGSLLLPIFGVFLWFSGVRELLGVRMRHAGLEFARAMGFEPRAEPAHVHAEVHGDGHDATRDSAAPSPDPETGARRPSVLRTQAAGDGEGFSDERIAEMERFRGSILRRPTPE